MNTNKNVILPDLLIKCVVCLIGIISLNMARTMGENLPALYGLESGGEVILMLPCIGWSLFISLPLALYAAHTHFHVSRLGYMELIRYGKYSKWRRHNYIHEMWFCLIYTFVAVASQFIFDSRYVADSAILTGGLTSASLILLSLIMQCAVFQCLYLQTQHGEKVLVIMILLNIVGAALGYVLPQAVIFMPASWAMYARSSAYIDGGYSILIALTIVLAIIACAFFIKPRVESSVFLPRNQAK